MNDAARQTMRAWPLIVLCGLQVGCGGATEESAYDIDIRQIERRIDAAQGPGMLARTSERASGRLAYLLYKRASLTGDFGHFREAERQIMRTLQAYPNSAECLLLKVDLNIKLHRFAAALADLHRLSGVTPRIRLLPRLADIALQYGQYDAAKTMYEELAATDPVWDNLARLAYYRSHTGQVMAAEELYNRAQDALSTRDLRAYAWLELQKGILDLEEQRYEFALAHFEKANRAYPGYWLIEEHLAEALGAMGQEQRAAEIYEEVINAAPHAYVFAALANLLNTSDPARAAVYADRARQAFNQEYAAYPQAAIGHYLEQLLQTGRPSRFALRLANLNHELRPNATSGALLARAHLLNGDPSSAIHLIRTLRTTPWRTQSIHEVLCVFAVQEGRAEAL